MRFPKVLSALVMGAGLAASAASHAQDAGEASAPVSIQSTEQRPQVYAIMLDAYPEFDATISGDNSLKWRRAELQPDWQSLFSANDPGFSAVLADPEQPSIFTNLQLSVSPEGKVTACALSERYPGKAELVPILCPLVTERLRFLPALDWARAPIEDKVRVHFSARHYGTKDGVAGLPIRGRDPDELAPPAPWPVSDFRKATDWPPDDGYNLRRGRPFFRFPDAVQDAPAGPADSNGRKVAGIALYTGENATTGCEPVISSGDASFDQLACAFVTEKAAPSYGNAGAGRALSYPLLVTGKRKPERIFAPVEKLIQWISLDKEQTDTFLGNFLPGFEAAGGDRKRLQLQFAVGADGRVSKCRIQSSSGTTEADIYACDAVERELVYQPATDAFGRPRDNVGVWWKVPVSPQ